MLDNDTTTGGVPVTASSSIWVSDWRSIPPGVFTALDPKRAWVFPFRNTPEATVEDENKNAPLLTNQIRVYRHYSAGSRKLVGVMVLFDKEPINVYTTQNVLIVAFPVPRGKSAVSEGAHILYKQGDLIINCVRVNDAKKVVYSIIPQV